MTLITLPIGCPFLPRPKLPNFAPLIQAFIFVFVLFPSSPFPRGGVFGFWEFLGFAGGGRGVVLGLLTFSGLALNKFKI